MHLKRYIALIICLLSTFATGAQVGGKPMLAVSGEGDSVVRILFEGDPDLLVVEDSPTPDYSLLRWGEMPLGTGLAGTPDLPSASTLLRLPMGSTLEVEEVSSLVTVWPRAVPYGKPLAPTTEGWVKDQPQPEYRPDKEIYHSMEPWRGGDRIEVENLGVMGDHQLFRVKVRPVLYQPVGGTLTIDNRIEAKLRVNGGEQAATVNEQELLIVSRPEFHDGLQPFVTWKRQEGYDVTELYATTHNRDTVKALIMAHVAANPWPGHLLIVGDAARIQAFVGQTSVNSEMHITDLYYADFTGDYLPEALAGRWPVNDTAELRTVVEKTLRYEQCNGLDTAQLRRMLLVAGSESASPAPITTNGQVHYVSREAKAAHAEIDTLCYYNPASAGQREAIQGDVGQGLGLLNYTAHCTVGGWTSPSFSATDVAQAGAMQPTVYVNNCCKSNDFGGTCFGEQLLRMPVGGAVGVIGATNSTLWHEDYYWSVGPKYPLSSDPAFDANALGAFDALVGGNRTAATMGELLMAGNLAVTAFGTSYDRFYWEVYCLLGDPTLRPWIGMPQQAALHITGDLVNGQSAIHVGGTPHATVTAMQGGSLIGRAVIGSDSLAAIPLRQTLDTLPLILTATGTNLTPSIDTFTVDTAVERGVTLRNVTVGDSAVHCIVENIGRQRYDSLLVVLSQPDGQHGGALIAEQTVMIDSLPPHLQAEVTLPVNIVEIGQLPQWQVSIFLWGDSVECELVLTHRLSIPYPTLSLRLLDSAANEARLLMPNRTYLIEATVDGPFDSLLVEVGHEEWTVGVDADAPSSTFHFPFATPDTLCALHIKTTLFYGNWQLATDRWVEPGRRHDGFESGFNGHLWQGTPRVPWVIDSTVSHSGRFSARSGNIADGQISDLCIELFLPHDDTLGYWVKSSTEAQHDKLELLVDGLRVQSDAWGESDWSHRRRNLSAGRHILCWRYVKDASVSSGSDCVWIDDIFLPFSFWDTLTAWECAIADPLSAAPSQLPTPDSLLSVYPNPSHGHVTVSVGTPSIVTLLDIQGRKVTQFEIRDSKFELDVSALSPGLYFIRANQHYGKLIIQ